MPSKPTHTESGTLLLAAPPETCPLVKMIKKNHKLVPAGVCGKEISVPAKSGFKPGTKGQWKARCVWDGYFYFDLVG